MGIKEFQSQFQFNCFGICQTLSVPTDVEMIISLTVQGLQILDKVPKLICWNIDPKEIPKNVRSKILMQFF